MTRTVSEIFVHATAIAIGGQGIVLTGPSGSGKSDLALRLIDRGAQLISDDIVRINNNGPAPLLFAAPNIAGMIEVRGVGIVKMPYLDDVPLRVAIAVDEAVDRMPPYGEVRSIAGFDVPAFALSAFEASAPIKVELALSAIINGGLFPQKALAQCTKEQSEMR